MSKKTKIKKVSLKSYTLLKISWNLFDKHFTELTEKQKSEVIDIYKSI